MLNRCLTIPDNSPEFLEIPSSLLCVGQDISICFTATDNDTDTIGNFTDSISYEMVNPKDLTFKSPYSYDEPIFYWGFPEEAYPLPRGFHFNKSNGQLSFRPMKVERTIIAVKAIEWRNFNGIWKKIAEVTRDFHLYSISCPNNFAPIIYSQYFKEVCAGDSIELTINTDDYDTQDTLMLTYNGKLENAVWTDNNKIVKHPTGIFKWKTESWQNGYYYFTVKVKDDACPVNGSSTKVFCIRVVPGIPKNTNLYFDTILNCNQHVFHAENSSINNAAFPNYYMWEFFTPSKKTFYGDKITFTAPSAGNYPFRLISGNPDGCHRTIHDTVFQPNVLFLDKLNDTVVCEGESVTLHAKYTGNTGLVKYKWSTGDTFNTLDNKVYKLSKLYLNITDSVGCMDFDTVIISTSERSKVDLGTDVYLCHNENTIIRAKVTGPYVWNGHYNFYDVFRNKYIQASDSHTITVDSGIFVCKILNSNFCENSDTIQVFKHAAMVAYAQDKTVCPYDTVVLNANATGTKSYSVIYEWHDNQSGQLFDTGINIKYIVSENKEFKLKVREFFNHKYCEDSTIVRASRIPVFVDFKPPALLCKNDSFINLNYFIDSMKGSITSKHNAVYKDYYFNPTKDMNDTGCIAFHLTDFNSGCQYDTTAKIIYLEIPIVKTYNQYNRNGFCHGLGNILIQAVPVGGIYGGKWYGAIDDGKYFNTDRNAGKYNLIYEYKDNNGCMNRDTMKITLGNPSVEIDKSVSSICSGEVMDIDAKYSVAPKILWYRVFPVDGYFTDGYYNPKNKYLPGFNDRQNKGFTIYAKTIDTLCPEVKDSIHVYIAAKPKADFSVNLSNVQLLNSVDFTDKSTIAYDSMKYYKWYFGDGSSSPVQNPSYKYLDTGNYNVSLKVTSNFGCSDSITKNKLIYVYAVSIPENFSNRIKVYPNPVSDKIYIESESGIEKLVLYNFIGAKIRETEVNGEKSAILEIGKLPSWMYFLRVFDMKNQVQVFQIVIQ